MRFFLGTGEQVDSCAAVVYIDRANLDIEYLHKTGKIKSTRDWNRNMSRNIYVYEDFTATGTIQGIVKDCRDFLSYVKFLFIQKLLLLSMIMPIDYPLELIHYIMTIMYSCT